MNFGRLVAGVIIIAIALVGLGMMAEMLNPPVEDEKSVSGNSSFSYQATLMGEDKIEGDFTVDNDTVTFFICTEDEYDEYSKTKNCSSIETFALLENVSSGNYSFETPAGDSIIASETWHIVIDTSDSSGDPVILDINIEYDPYKVVLYYVQIILLVLGSIRIIQGLLPAKKEGKNGENEGEGSGDQ
jgi:hypothetical protein